MINRNIENKKNEYENLKTKITVKYKSDIKSINKIIKVMKDNSCINKDDSLETIIFKKYLELENVKRVADHINSLGYRIKTTSYIGQRKYTGNDISEIIITDAKVEKRLKETVKELHSQHSIAMIKRYC